MKRFLLSLFAVLLSSSSLLAFDTLPLYVELGPTGGQKVGFTLESNGIGSYAAKLIVSGTSGNEIIEVSSDRTHFQFKVWISGTKYTSGVWSLDPDDYFGVPHVVVDLDTGNDTYFYVPYANNTNDHPTHTVNWYGEWGEIVGVQTGNRNDVVNLDSPYDNTLAIVSLNGGNDTYNGGEMEGSSYVWSGALTDSVSAGSHSSDYLWEGNDGSTSDSKSGFETTENSQGSTEYWFTEPGN